MLDQWDWKTSAPEFVPGSLQSGSSPSNGPPAVAASPAPRAVTAPGPAAPRPLGTAVFGPVVGACFAPMTESNGMCMPPMSHGMCAAPGGPTGGFWHQGFQSYDMPPSRPQSMHEPIFGKEKWEEEEDYAERIRAAQVQARYEMQLWSKEEELRSLQDRLNRKEDETARMQADFERDRQGLLYNLNQLSHAVAEKKVQDRYDNRDRGDKGGYRQKGNREASERNYSGQGFPGGKEHRFGVKERKSSMVSKPRRDDVAPPPEARPRRAPPAAVMSAVGTWSGARLEKFVRQTPGAMELRPHHAADGSTSWTLKLCMDELTPPLNDEGMQVFCRWLHHTFQLMREQHQIRSMQMVWAEVSLAWNQMGDDAVGRLLQALQRSQLRVRTLKFRGNGIGSAGLSQICDFIHEAQFNLRELDLSQNFLEESSGALELLTLFVEHPKYSKDRPNKVEPVKVDLSHNGLHTSKVLKKLGSIAGLSLQSLRRSPSASSREWQVLKNGVPLLRLPDFEAQDDLDDRKERWSQRAPANVPSAAGATAGREASPPEETPEPSWVDKEDRERRGDMKQRKADPSRRGTGPLVKKVLRQQNGIRDLWPADKTRIEEHPNEDDADEDHPKEKVIEDDLPVPGLKEQDDLPAPPKVRLVAPPKILQRGAVLAQTSEESSE